MPSSFSSAMWQAMANTSNGQNHFWSLCSVFRKAFTRNGCLLKTTVPAVTGQALIRDPGATPFVVSHCARAGRNLQSPEDVSVFKWIYPSHWILVQPTALPERGILMEVLRCVLHDSVSVWMALNVLERKNFSHVSLLYELLSSICTYDIPWSLTFTFCCQSSKTVFHSL